MVIPVIYLFTQVHNQSDSKQGGNIDTLVFLFPPAICSSVDHSPHSKKAFICYNKLGKCVWSILADLSGELCDHKKSL